MTIKYLPAYQGFTYLNLGAHDNSLAIDCCVENTLGLLNCLELYAGHHVECLSNKQRVAHYYSAMLDYTNKHENHKLADSFRLDVLEPLKPVCFGEICLSRPVGAVRHPIHLAGWKSCVVLRNSSTVQAQVRELTC